MYFYEMYFYKMYFYEMYFYKMHFYKMYFYEMYFYELHFYIENISMKLVIQTSLKGMSILLYQALKDYTQHALDVGLVFKLYYNG